LARQARSALSIKPSSCGKKLMAPRSSARVTASPPPLETWRAESTARSNDSTLDRIPRLPTDAPGARSAPAMLEKQMTAARASALALDLESETELHHTLRFASLRCLPSAPSSGATFAIAVAAQQPPIGTIVIARM
jgi:hypothetical protein